MGERLKGPEKKEKRYRWDLKPGRRFFVMQGGPDTPDWYPVEVPEGCEVTVTGSKVRREGKGYVGLGRISEITGDGSFFCGEVFVCVGLKAKVPFGKKK